MLHVKNLRGGAEQFSGPHEGAGLSWGGSLLFWVGADQTIWGFDPAQNSAFPVARSSVRSSIGAGGGTLSYFLDGPDKRLIVRSKAIAGLLPTAPRDAASPEVVGRSYFPQTGHTLGGDFRAYWQRNGGLPVFGLPLSEEFVQQLPGQSQGFTVQYLERQRYELHPENPEPYGVLLGRLGVEALAAQGRYWQRFPKANPSVRGYFPQTGQALAPEFWNAWWARGLELGDRGVSEREAVALWGYPISPPQLEEIEGRQVLVQWFERARFEYHPQNPDPYRVLLGRLAAEQLERFGWR